MSCSGYFNFYFYLIFNYEFWTKCTVSRISKVNYENVYIFGIKLFNFIIFSTHQIWDLDSTKIQISTVLFVIVANIFHFDYQYTFTAPNIANPRLISSTLCVMSLLFWDIYVKILKSLNDWCLESYCFSVMHPPLNSHYCNRWYVLRGDVLPFGTFEKRNKNFSNELVSDRNWPLTRQTYNIDVQDSNFFSTIGCREDTN